MFVCTVVYNVSTVLTDIDIGRVLFRLDQHRSSSTRIISNENISETSTVEENAQKSVPKMYMSME